MSRSKSSLKVPPRLSQAKSYEDWVKLLDIWTEYSELEKEKQGPALLFTLEDNAQQVVIEALTKEEIGSETGVEKIKEQLHKLYKKDEITQKYNALEAFETYRKNSTDSFRTFIAEFEKNTVYHSKLKF